MRPTIANAICGAVCAGGDDGEWYTPRGAGALIAVGSGKLTREALQEALARGSSKPPCGSFRGWHIADAHGLCLTQVMMRMYNDDNQNNNNINFDDDEGSGGDADDGADDD